MQSAHNSEAEATVGGARVGRGWSCPRVFIWVKNNILAIVFNLATQWRVGGGIYRRINNNNTCDRTRPFPSVFSSLRFSRSDDFEFIPLITSPGVKSNNRRYNTVHAGRPVWMRGNVEEQKVQMIVGACVYVVGVGVVVGRMRGGNRKEKRENSVGRHPEAALVLRII